RVSDPLDYRTAGVDIDAADESKRRITAHVLSTLTSGARGEFGGFGGMFRVPTDVPKPVLVASADGVGTKLKVAIDAGRYDTVGHDLVNHCVNDILVQGASPLFFLDYVAFGALDPRAVEGVVAGVAAGCRENGCALLGGETAEMPGVYTPPDYDLAGFIVGYVDEDAILGPARVREGDVLVALESSGLHTNGFSLARRIVDERMQLDTNDRFPGDARSVADVLLAVHRSYLESLRPVLSRVHAMAHITGGGIPGNLNRALPPTLDAVVDTSTWEIPNLFRQLAQAGGVDRDEMFRAFNMGVGMLVIGPVDAAGDVIAAAAARGVKAWRAGVVQNGSGRVILN
ncbi:MAG TPA: phosphoribosylformylglycinamidine cyclo-ligase, partial [Gemmatimonadaceae bacterium]|nr:phosphoribosylformylglycinamidine cyclo-ligase [Gemmatimonadaceae bacterium]